MSVVEKTIDETIGDVGIRAKRRTSALGAIGAWIDARTGLARAGRAIFLWPAPKYVEWNLLYALGGLTLFSLLLQFFTGFCMTFYYAANPEDAYNSVDYITYQSPLGWLIRGIHHYNASAIIILVFLHTLRTFFFSAYKKPREITWLSGVLLLVVTLGFGFTGYLLPWDQKGYWSTMVGTKLAGKTPLIGDYLLRLLSGGPTIGYQTLSRFYVIHVTVLPMTLMALTALHLFQHRYHGVAPRPESSRGKRSQALSHKFVPYYPNWMVMEVALGLGLLGLLIFLSWYKRAPLEFPADPTSIDYNPRPEWYFLFLFQLLHYVPGHLESLFVVLVPLIVLGSMLLLPFLDRGEERRPWCKPVTTAIALFYVAVIVILTLAAL
jgi:ubiquinol-cytochrome c reductase cytochrome b subunit